ncbi:MAG: L-histidine N(alpha)-methyltransferase, partial [Planctomycetota bacterium]
MNSSTDLETRFRDAIARGAPLLSVKSGAHVERSFADEVAEGLAATPRWLPTRFLYDAEGSRLFEAITNLPEYYPTRTEAAILAEHADSIVQRVGRVTLVELGSGYSVKTAHLLRAFGDVRYVPIDVSADALMAA